MTDLKSKNLLSDRIAGLIEESFSDVSVELFRRILSGKNRNTQTHLSHSHYLYIFIHHVLMNMCVIR